MKTPHPDDSARDRVWHPYTRFSALSAPDGLPCIVGAKGVDLIASDGRRLFDAISSWWACALGHSHPRLVEAIRRQAGELQHSILGNLTHPGAAELARQLAELMPTPDRHVMFASDGASAIEAALKIALQFHANRGAPARRRFAYLEGAYHGDTLGAISVGYLDSFHEPFRSVLAPALRLPVPRTPEEEGRIADAVRQTVRQHRDELAALVVEPLCQGAAGMRMYPPAFLRFLADLSRECGIVLIADEIAMGFGRTGRFFAFEHAGIDPDIVCVGKALSGGYLPISAAIVRDNIYETFADRPADHTFYHGHTFCGNPIACAAALEALRLYRELDIPACARRLEAAMRAELEPLRAHPGVKDVRFLGAIAAVELADLDPPGVASRRAQVIRERLLEHNILLRPLGPVVYLMPPLVTPPNRIRSVATTLRESVIRGQ